MSCNDILCKGCETLKGEDDFYTKVSNKAGIRQPCKGCIKLQGEQKRKEYKGVGKKIPVEKECGTCGEIKPSNCFPKRSDTPTGLQSDCKDCRKVKRHNHYEGNKDHVYETVKAYREANPHKSAEWTRAWRASNPERVLDLEREYRNKNRDKINKDNRERRNCPEYKAKVKLTQKLYLSNPVNAAKKKEASRLWRARNKSRICYHSNKRRAYKLQATPPWADQLIIQSFYQEAQYHNMQVDHIIPLTHPLVCGLHCEFNLQLLTKKENVTKNNSFEIQEHEVPECLEFTYEEREYE